MKRVAALFFFALIFGSNGVRAETENSGEISAVSSEVCKACHEDIHNFWKNSMHAYSFSDPIFRTAYDKALKLSGESKKLCLRCHAPITQFNGDYDLEQEVTKEGVTCDFCHTIIGVSQESGNYSYEFNFDRTRVGPLKNADSPLHRTAYSELHTKSEFCAGCHEYTNEAGAKLLETYSEWKNGPYASEGVQCQNCHMPMTEGFVVKPAVKQTERGINFHNLQGGHSAEKVKTAASVKITDILKFPGSVRITVDVTNTGSGHRIPTGTPSRELLLEAGVFSVPHDRLIEKKTVVFKKTVLGPHGQVLDRDAEIMVNAVKILSDNRIYPRETRSANFTFVGIPTGSYLVRAKLHYNYLAETSPGEMHQMLIEMAADQKSLYVD